MRQYHFDMSTAITTIVRRGQYYVAVVGLALTVGCVNEITQAPIPVPSATRSVFTAPVAFPVVKGSKYRRPGEDRFVGLGQQEPSIGGFFINEDGALVLLVADSTKLVNARQAFEAARLGLALEAPYNTAPLIVRRAKYSFQQLSVWRDTVTDVVLGRVPGVVWDDLDERRNRVALGVLRGSEGPVMAAIRDLGIPTEAVALVPARMPQEMNSSEEKTTTSESIENQKSSLHPVAVNAISIDSLAGGVLITRSGGSCTLGFLAYISGSLRGLSASHCSTQKWTRDSTVWSINNKRTMYESADPDAASCPLFQQSWCHYERGSDVSANTFYTDSVPNFAFGRLVRPANRAYETAGTNIIDTLNPWLFITGQSAGTIDGQALNKIGQRTGWTYGNVNATCFDLTRQYERHLCASKVHAWGRSGDSGGPVFSWNGEDGVVLYGISSQLDECTFGSPPDCQDYDIWFSVMGSIAGDLGSMSVALGATVGTPSPSGAVSGGQPSLSWSAVSTTNTVQTTRYRIYRSTWDASTYSWIDNGLKVGETTGTSFTDPSFPLSMNSYQGTSAPGECIYSYTRYTVSASNTGVGSESTPVYFQGAANGPTPTQISCP
ncbi:MAG: hypothetical protein ABI969_00245 [bacterium]